MITINMDKAREITHDKRRVWRDAKFAPYDIKVTIPAEAANAEAERVGIRIINTSMKELINAATSADELKAIIEQLEAK